VPRLDRVISVTPEDRAKAVAERFAAELPSRSVPELERIVTSAIRRALGQQLAELEDWAKRSAEYAMGRGKNGKGRNEAAMRIHDEWAGRFKRLRNGAK
jgi:uncharacterized membrane protein YgcG